MTEVSNNFEWWISMGNLSDLISTATPNRIPAQEHYAFIKKAGFNGVSGVFSELNYPLLQKEQLQFSITISFLDLSQGIHDLQQALSKVPTSVNIHLGIGTEEDQQIVQWLNAIQDIQTTIPIYIETHRGTVTQDPYRCLALLRQFPALRFTGDFSHWYISTLMADHFQKKFNAILPILQNTRMIHARMSSPGMIQPPLKNIFTEDKNHFLQLWNQVLRLNPDHKIPIVIELLSHQLGYAPATPTGEDAVDRWEEAIHLKSIFNAQ